MEKLFSYGTLQMEKVQLETFGRKLIGKPDTLTRYKLDKIQIQDPKVLELSQIEEHLILKYSGNEADTINGVIFEVTKQELVNADKYEEENYKRILETFQSGEQAWVYIEAKS